MEDSIKTFIKVNKDEILPTSRLEDFVIGMVDKVTEIKENYANIQINVDYNDVYEAIENAKDDFIRLLCDEKCIIFEELKDTIKARYDDAFGKDYIKFLSESSFTKIPPVFTSWCLLQMIENINCWIEL